MDKKELVSQTVYHELFGKGIIKNITDSNVEVSFKNDVKRFIYPDAFEKFLTLDDIEYQKFTINQLEEKKQLKANNDSQIKKTDSFIQRKKLCSISNDIKQKRRPRYTYTDWELEFPDYVIIQKEGFMYTAHNKSAEILNYVLDYELFIDEYGRQTTGGPDSAKIALALENYQYSYLIIVDRQIVDGIIGKNPFDC